MAGLKFPLRSKPAAFKFMGEPRLMNCFPEEIGEEQKSPVAILSIPGQDVLSTPSEDPSRGMFPIDDDSVIYSAHLSKLYKVNSAGTATAVTGTLAGSRPIISARGAAVARSGTVTLSLASPGIVTDPLHRLQAGDEIAFSTDGTLPTGLDGVDSVFVLASDLTPNQYKVSLTAGGAAINFTGSQTGTHTRISQFTTIQTGIVSDTATFILERDILYYQTLRKQANSTAHLAFRQLYFYDDGSFDYSALNDARTIAGFAEAERLPDGLVRGITHLGQLFLAGKKSIEIWTTTTSPTAPYRPLGGAFIDVGILARDTFIPWDGGLFGVGHDGIGYKFDGYQKAPVTDSEIERLIADLGTEAANLRAFVHTYNGHPFLVLTCDQWTKALDARTGFWHDRSSYQRPDWRAGFACDAFGLTIVSDKASGQLRYLNADAFDEAGDHLVMEMTLPDIPGEIIVDRIDFDVATGQGLNVLSTVDGHNPILMLWASRDGGNTWPIYKEAKTGTNGQWLSKVRFNSLGKSRERGWRFKIAMSAPCARGFALADMTGAAVKR